MATDGKVVMEITQLLIDINIRDIEIPTDTGETLQTPDTVTNNDLSVFQCTPAKASTYFDRSQVETPSQSSMSSSAEVFSTPISQQTVCCTDEKCSVCLSPLLCRSTLVETRCKHVFHEKCLMAAKGRKAECPNCRALLTPLQTALPVTEDCFPITFDFSMGHRGAIVSRSAAARDAVRLGIVRRDHERRRALAEALDSNKENI